jgi:hypothetical protein
MKTKRVHLKAILAGALLLAPCASPAPAGVSLLYFVGYGLYPYGATDVTTTAPSTGLLANNGSGRALVQLIYAGPDHMISLVEPYNPLNGYVSGDDVVWQSSVIAAGTNDTDEWGFSNIPLAYTNLAWATAGFVFIRVFQDDTPQAGEAYYETSLLAMNTASALDGIFSQCFFIGSSTAGVALDRLFGSTAIQNVEFNPETAGLVFAVPNGYALWAVYGADSVVPSGDWNWQKLVEGTHYSNENNVVTLLTTGDNAAPLQMIRLGLLRDF